MVPFLFKRFLQLIPVLWGVGTLVFLMLHLVPGDPVEIMLGENAQATSKETLRASLHLDKPLHTQYLMFWSDVLRGNLGTSFLSKRSVSSLIAERVFATLTLALSALAWAVAIALPLGILAASFPRTLLDRAVLFFSVLGVSMPSFWFGPLLMLLFAVELGWFPVSEQEGLLSYVLPSLTLGLGLSAILTRMTRATMAEVLSADYITTARSKGLSWRGVYLKHALKNALIPIITILGLQLGSLLGGAVIAETIFDWPGIGELVYRAIQSRDFPVVQGCVLIISVTFVFANTLADIAYSFANPRIELK